MGQTQPIGSSGPGYVVNQLDAASNVHFSSSRVQDVLFSDHNRTITFPPWIKTLKCVHLSETLRKSVDNQSLCVRLKVTYEDFCQVVIGLQCASLDALSEDIGHYVLLDVTEGRVYSKGSELVKARLPICASDGEIELQFDMNTSQIHYSVSNPGSPVTHCPPIRLTSTPDTLLPTVGVLSTSRQPVQCSILPSTARASLYPQFDGSTCHGPIVVSSDGLTVRRDGNCSNCSVLINRVLTRGKHSWVLKVISDEGASTCLGVAKVPLTIPSKFDQEGVFLYSHPDMYLWRSYQGLLYCNGVKQQRSLASLDWTNSAPVTVRLTMDMDQGVLTIHRNNALLGRAFEGLDGPLQPVVVFYSNYDKHIQLVSYENSPLCSIAVSDSADEAVSSEPSAYFDASTARGLVKVSEDGLTLTRTVSCSGNAYCLLSKHCTSGIYRWSLRSHGNQGTGVCLGVTSEPVAMPTNEDIYVSGSVCVVGEGKVYLRGRELSKKIKDKWTTIEIVCDLVHRVMHVSVDGESEGAVCSLEEGYYRPIVGFYDRAEQEVSLEAFGHTEVCVSTSAGRGPGVNEVDDPKGEGPVTSHQLPIMAAVSEALDVCITCSTANSNIIILPCKHVIYCPLCATQTSNCVVCDSPITDFWNVF